MPIKLYSKDEILNSCRSAFAQYGYDATSTQSLADLAGVSKALVFHHFGSKKELYFTILERGLAKYNEEVDLSKIDKVDFYEVLSEFVNMKLAYCRENADDYGFIQSTFNAGPKKLRKEIEERFGSIAPTDIPELKELFQKVTVRFVVNREDAFNLIFMAIDGFEQRFIKGLTGNKAKDNEHLEIAKKQIASCINMIRYGIE